MGDVPRWSVDPHTLRAAQHPGIRPDRPDQRECVPIRSSAQPGGAGRLRPVDRPLSRSGSTGRRARGRPQRARGRCRHENGLVVLTECPDRPALEPFGCCVDHGLPDGDHGRCLRVDDAGHEMRDADREASGDQTGCRPNPRRIYPVDGALGSRTECQTGSSVARRSSMDGGGARSCRSACTRDLADLLRGQTLLLRSGAPATSRQDGAQTASAADPERFTERQEGRERFVRGSFLAWCQQVRPDRGGP